MRTLPGAAVRTLAQLTACTVLLLTAACGGKSPGGPSTFPPPSLSCPTDIEVSANPGQPAVVSYAVPAAANGAPPVTVTCAPGSGSSFNVGTNQVACTATDAQARSATCGFKVVVTEVPQIDKVKFLAFGDSVTRGTVSSPCQTNESFEAFWGALAVSVPESYPFKLQALLAARYSSQTIEVINEGVGGEKIAEGTSRLPGLLDAVRPDVLLLLHGYNDLRAAGRADTFDTEIPRIAGQLEQMVDSGRRRNIPVLIATIHAMDASGCRGQGAPGVTRLNDRIRRVAADEGAIVADLYGGLGASSSGVVGIDGLHPTDEGYTKMAQVWFDAITQRFERPSPTDTAAGPVIVVRPMDEIR